METRFGEMMVIFPATRSSKMKFRFVCSLMNLMRTGRSTSVKSRERYTDVEPLFAAGGDGDGSFPVASEGGDAAGERTEPLSGAGAVAAGAFSPRAVPAE